jgi:SAM-dependent methyltransferase
VNILIEKTLLQVLVHAPLTKPYRILEIGAGTGSTTCYLLPHLRRGCAEYTFTDVFIALLLEAQEKFKDYDFVEYRSLNIELEPQRQGFDCCHYDFVVATNVFHATRDLAGTLRNTRQLLTPGGLRSCLNQGPLPAGWISYSA